MERAMTTLRICALLALICCALSYFLNMPLVVAVAVICVGLLF